MMKKSLFVFVLFLEVSVLLAFATIAGRTFFDPWFKIEHSKETYVLCRGKKGVEWQKCALKLAVSTADAGYCYEIHVFSKNTESCLETFSNKVTQRNACYTQVSKTERWKCEKDFKNVD